MMIPNPRYEADGVMPVEPFTAVTVTVLVVDANGRKFEYPYLADPTVTVEVTDIRDTGPVVVDDHGARTRALVHTTEIKFRRP